MFFIAPSGVVFLVLDFFLAHHGLLIIQFPMCAVLRSVGQLTLDKHELFPGQGLAVMLSEFLLLEPNI